MLRSVVSIGSIACLYHPWPAGQVIFLQESDLLCRLYYYTSYQSHLGHTSAEGGISNFDFCSLDLDFLWTLWSLIDMDLLPYCFNKHPMRWHSLDCVKTLADIWILWILPDCCQQIGTNDGWKFLAQECQVRHCLCILNFSPLCIWNKGPQLFNINF